MGRTASGQFIDWQTGALNSWASPAFEVLGDQGPIVQPTVKMLDATWKVLSALNAL